MNIRSVFTCAALIGLFGIVGTMDYNDECTSHGGKVVNNQCVNAVMHDAVEHHKEVTKERKARIVAERAMVNGVEFIIEQ